MKEYITGFDQLYRSAWKCQANVTWKPSVKSFMLNAEENIHRMRKQTQSGTWKHGKPRKKIITYPKKREALSIPYKDRVYQRSINDNSLYPQMTRSFIYANCACQTGKGTDFARKLVKKYMWNYFCKYGNQGYVMQIDIHGYYQNMKHEEVSNWFKTKVDPDTYEMSMSVLDTQYSGDTGYNPGSQMVQIAGISLLDPLDHYIKEQLHVHYYIRYQDDFWILWHDYEDLENWFETIKAKLKEKGFEANEKKSHITPLSKGFRFLGFDYRMTETGKIIMTLNSQNTKHERKKLVRMNHKVARGEMDDSIVDENFRCWKNNASKGNSEKLIKRTERYLKHLRKEHYAVSEKNIKPTGRSRKRDPESNCGKSAGRSYKDKAASPVCS